MSTTRACTRLLCRSFTSRQVPSAANRRILERRLSTLRSSCSAERSRPFPSVNSSGRYFSTTSTKRHGDIKEPKPGEGYKVTFVDKENQSHTFEVAEGDNLLDVAQHYMLDVEGACGGSCACSTCHLIVEDEDMFNKIPEATDDENDMLDLAFGLTGTSRLGCQVKMEKELDGLIVRLPRLTRNMQASDFTNK